MTDAIPEGYRLEETNERVGIQPERRFFRWRAERAARRERPLPSYRLCVEKVGPFLYEIVAYQNKLVENTPRRALLALADELDVQATTAQPGQVEGIEYAAQLARRKATG